MYQEFGQLDEENLMFYAVLSELANVYLVGASEEKEDKLVAAKGHEIQAFKRELPEKYATEEHL